MQQSWRWFGPDDKVPLHAIRQAGAEGVVTSLHHIPYGEVWSVAEIEKRQHIIAADAALGLRWNVVESLPLHERIKLGEGDLTPIFDNYRASMRNLAACGIKIICYNFMPVLDWTRTTLHYPRPGGGLALRFDATAYAAFDVFMLQRKGAEGDHAPATLVRARHWFDHASLAEKDQLLASIMAGLPGAFDRYDIPALRKILARYDAIDASALRQNLKRFLEEVIPTAEDLGMRFAIHPDDPPRPLLGLPRIVSNRDDLRFIVDAVPSHANGITFCTGSLGAGVGNDVPALAREFSAHSYFVHLRNVTKEADGSFFEADHLAGDNDMIAIVETFLQEQARRKAAGAHDWRLPFRPDHGHELLDDVDKGAFPGYSAIGRLKGLAELRGVMLTLARAQHLPLA